LEGRTSTSKAPASRSSLPETSGARHQETIIGKPIYQQVFWKRFRDRIAQSVWSARACSRFFGVKGRTSTSQSAGKPAHSKRFATKPPKGYLARRFPDKDEVHESMPAITIVLFIRTQIRY
jgi:hypothetical protein